MSGFYIIPDGSGVTKSAALAPIVTFTGWQLPAFDGRDARLADAVCIFVRQNDVSFTHLPQLFSSGERWQQFSAAEVLGGWKEVLAAWVRRVVIQNYAHRPIVPQHPE